MEPARAPHVQRADGLRGRLGAVGGVAQAQPVEPLVDGGLGEDDVVA